jgi:uncharacterized protein YkwD
MKHNFRMVTEIDSKKVDFVNKLIVTAITFGIINLLSTGTLFSQTTQIRGQKRIITSSNRREVSNDDKIRSSSDISVMERKVFALVNQKRTEKGLKALTWSDDSAKVARLHSKNMVAFNFFSHYDKNKFTVAERANSIGFKKWQSIGENIAYIRGFDNPVEFIVDQWMNSKSHRKNILDKGWSKSAIGIATSQDGTLYFTEVFIDS